MEIKEKGVWGDNGGVGRNKIVQQMYINFRSFLKGGMA